LTVTFWSMEPVSNTNIAPWTQTFTAPQCGSVVKTSSGYTNAMPGQGAQYTYEPIVEFKTKPRRNPSGRVKISGLQYQFTNHRRINQTTKTYTTRRRNGSTAKHGWAHYIQIGSYPG